MFVQDLDDRRDTIRINFITDVSVTFHEQNKIIRGELINLSMSGMSLHTMAQFHVGSPCTVKILINGRYSHLVVNKLEGEVVRSEPDMMAIKFKHRFQWLALFHVYICNQKQSKVTPFQ